MIIRIKPLRHFKSGRCVGAVSLALRPDITSRHLEIGGQIYRGVTPGETVRNAADQCCGVTHLVIETEVVTWDQVDPTSLLFLPVMPSQLCCVSEQLGFGNRAVPKRFRGSFEFPVFANPRIAEIMGFDLSDCLHGLFFLRVCGCPTAARFCEAPARPLRPCSGLSLPS